MTTSNLKVKRCALAFLAIFVAVLVALFLIFHSQPPLSSLERQLEGEWYSDPKDSGYTTTYAADRTLSTSNGQ